MVAISELHAEHAALKADAERLLAIVDADAPDPAAAAEARRALGHCLQAHCMREDREVYDWLLTSGDATATPVAWRYRQDYGQIETRFGRYVAAWPVSNMTADWEAFRTETQGIIALLLERILHEEATLYPLVARVQASRTARASAVEQNL